MQVILKLCLCLPAYILRYSWTCLGATELITKLNLICFHTVLQVSYHSKNLASLCEFAAAPFSVMLNYIVLYRLVAKQLPSPAAMML